MSLDGNGYPLRNGWEVEDRRESCCAGAVPAGDEWLVVEAAGRKTSRPIQHSQGLNLSGTTSATPRAPPGPTTLHPEQFAIEQA